MVSVSLFKSCVTKTNVRFFRFRGGDLCLINNALDITISVKGAGILFTAITGIICFIRGFCFFGKFSFVVVGDYCLDVGHAAIAKFKSVPVEDFIKRMGDRKVLIYKRKEAFSDFCFNIFTVWWIKPRYVSFAISAFSSRCIKIFFNVRKFVGVATFVKCVLVNVLCVVETFLVRRYF